MAVYLAFSKVFGSVNYVFLLQKLYYYWIRVAPYIWFKFCIYEHKQYVSTSINKNEPFLYNQVSPIFYTRTYILLTVY